MLLLPTMLLLSVSLTAAQSSGSSYQCPNGSQRTLTNFGGYTFQLSLTPAGGSYLLPNMDCGILIIGYSTTRWLITIDSISLGAYNAQLSIQDGGINGKEITAISAAGTPYRQIGTYSGTFNVRLTTKSGPAGLAFGVRLTIEKLDSGDCPSGWYTVPSSNGYCYGVPKMAGNLTYDEATKACNKMLGNLVMGNFDYDSISHDLMAAPSSVLNPKVAYWVGLYNKDDELKFLNKYNTIDSVSGRFCTMSSSNCHCVAYQNSRFYRDDCDSKRPYACYMPRGGTNSFYDVSSLEATGGTVITIVAIVLAVGFILAVLISLIVVLVCCIRRKSARCQSDAAGGPVFVGSPPHQAMPPPYPVASPQAPPYTIDLPSAPPYTAYVNGAFDTEGAAAATGAEKPPPYSTEWSGQQVPA